jgi:hypothetical protein
MKLFPAKLRTLRQQHGMTQQNVADQLGVSDVYIHKLETGKKRPNVDFALRLAKLFGVTIDQLVNDEIALE